MVHVVGGPSRVVYGREGGWGVRVFPWYDVDSRGRESFILKVIGAEGDDVESGIEAFVRDGMVRLFV